MLPPRAGRNLRWTFAYPIPGRRGCRFVPSCLSCRLRARDLNIQFPCLTRYWVSRFSAGIGGKCGSERLEPMPCLALQGDDRLDIGEYEALVRKAMPSMQ